MKKVLPSFGNNHKGGIIICHLALHHAQRLAANLKLFFKENGFYNDYELNVIATSLNSHFVKNDINNQILEVRDFQTKDSLNVQEMYNCTPCKYYVIEQNEKTCEFICEEFDKIIQEEIAFISSKREFTIYNMTAEKALDIIDLDGEILQWNANLKNAKINIDSNRLNSSIREQLGIDRSLITLGKNAKSCLDNLSDIGSVTIEKTESVNKFLITYPKELSSVITQIVMNKPQRDTSPIQH